MAAARSGPSSTPTRSRAKNGMPTPPNVDIAAGFFFSADTLADLANKIVMKYQRVTMPPRNLERDRGAL